MDPMKVFELTVNGINNSDATAALLVRAGAVLLSCACTCVCAQLRLRSVCSRVYVCVCVHVCVSVQCVLARVRVHVRVRVCEIVALTKGQGGTCCIVSFMASTKNA